MNDIIQYDGNSNWHEMVDIGGNQLEILEINHIHTAAVLTAQYHFNKDI